MDLRVGVVASYFYPRGYGGNAVYELCRHLVKNGLEIHVITSSIDGESNYQLLQGIYVHRIPTYFLRLSNTEYPVSPTALGNIFKIVSDYNVDLIHAHFEAFQTAFASSIIKRIAKKPMVLTMHGQGLTKYSSYGTEILDLIWMINYNIVERSVVRSADKIIALTTAVEAKALRLGAGPQKISVIPNGVDTEYFKPFNPGNENGELFMAAKHKIILFVGRLHPTHGIIFLLNAIPQVIKTYPESRFILVGDGPLRKQVLQFIESRHLEKYVKVLGFREDIPQLLNRAQLFVYPALSVGMPLSILEAMACGKPVIAFDVEGNRNIIINGKTGLLIQRRSAEELASAIKYMLSDSELLRDMGQNARKYVEPNFSWHKISKKVESVYKELF